MFAWLAATTRVLSTSIDYLGGTAPQLDTVQLDTDHGTELLDAEG